MEKIIKIGEKEVRLNNNLAWTMEYRDQFGKDILPVIMPMIASIVEMASSIISEAKGDTLMLKDLASALEGRALDILLPMFQVEFVDTIINVTWSMAKAADEKIDPPKKWIRQFDEFPLDIILPEIWDLLLKGLLSSKNRERLTSIRKKIKASQPSLSTMSSSQHSKED